MKKLFFYWLPILLYLGLIFILSARSSPQRIPQWPFIDKLLHFGAYTILGALFLRAFQTTRLKAHRGKIIFLCIFLSSLYGLSDEFHQYFVPARNADIMDAVADIIGSVFGVLAYESIHRNFKMKSAAVPPD